MKRFDLRTRLKNRDFAITLMFCIDGLLMQLANSTKSFGNNLLATNLGATDTQIGLIATVGCAATLALLLPVGIMGDRCRSTKTMPVMMLILAGLMFIFEAAVPFLPKGRIPMFFISMGLAGGFFGTYSGQWQTMFGDIVDIDRRNTIYARRSRAMAILGIVVPIVLGALLARQYGQQNKAVTLSVFYAISGVGLLIEAFVVFRIPGDRSEEARQAIEKFSIAGLKEALVQAVKNKPLISCVIASMLIYTAWQLDWSMWYIGQTQYALFNEAHLSYNNAIASLVSVASYSLTAILNRKKSAHFTVAVCSLWIVLYPIYMIIIPSVPAGIRPWVMLACIGVAVLGESGIVMCLVQMLLEAAPVKHRSLTISLYTVLTTLSNCVMPYIGVKIYAALGSDLFAFRTFFTIETCYRIFVGCYMTIRYLRMKKRGMIVLHG